MFKYIKLSEYREAAIWIDELPDAALREGRLVSFALPAVDAVLSKRQAAVEFGRWGCKSDYALLGGTSQPASGKQLNVSITVGGNVRAFKSALHGNAEPKVGLPQEYLRGIEDGVRSAIETSGKVPSGDIILNHGAFSEIDSCIAVFKSVTAILIRVLTVPSTDQIELDQLFWTSSQEGSK